MDNSDFESDKNIVGQISVARWLLLLVIVAGVYFFHGFLVPVLSALIIGFASWPLYGRLVRATGGNYTTAAAIALVAVLSCLIVPMAYAFKYAYAEVVEWASWAIRVNAEGAHVPVWIHNLPSIGPSMAEIWEENVGAPGALGRLSQAAGANIGGIYSTVMTASGTAFGLMLSALFMLITLFFVYRNGPDIALQVNKVGEHILPNRWGRFSNIIPATISSTVTGMTVIAIGEGVVLGIAYWLAGVPSPITFGVITAFMAMIPGGAPLSFTLISIYLVASGSVFEGICLMTWGTVELFIVDKTLRPHLVGGPIKLPFLPTFFGLVGGVKTMGFVGLFLGPVLMALLFAIWSEWLREIEKQPQH